MPANTLNDMVLGFAVILGTILIYIITLIIRIRSATKHGDKNKHQ